MTDNLSATDRLAGVPQDSPLRIFPDTDAAYARHRLSMSDYERNAMDDLLQRSSDPAGVRAFYFNVDFIKKNLSTQLGGDDYINNNWEHVRQMVGRNLLNIEKDDITEVDFAKGIGKFLHDDYDRQLNAADLYKKTVDRLMDAPVSYGDVVEMFEAGDDGGVGDEHKLARMDAFFKLAERAEQLRPLAMEVRTLIADMAKGRQDVRDADNADRAADLDGTVSISAFFKNAGGRRDLVKKQVKDVAKLKEYIAKLAPLSDADLGIFLEMITAKGASETSGERGAADNMAETLGRGLVSVLDKHATTLVDSNRLANGAKVLKNLDNIKIPKAVQSGRGAGMHNLSSSHVRYSGIDDVIDRPGVFIAGKRTGWRPLTSDEKSQLREKAENEAAVYNVTRRLRELANGVVDPVRGDNFFTDKMLYPAMESLPHMAQAFIPYAGIPLLVSANYGDSFEQMIDRGVSADDAQWMAAVATGPMTLLDFVESKLLIGRVPGLGRALSNLKASGFSKLAARAGITAAAEWGTETAVEVAQDLMPLLAQELGHALNEEIPGVKWDEYRKKFWGNVAEIGLVMVPLTLIGTGAAVGRDVSYLHDRRLLQAAGLTDAAISQMESATDAESASALLWTIWDNHQLRKPGSAEAKAAMKDLSAALEGQAQLVKGGATIRRRGDAYEVRDGRGKRMGSISTIEAAWGMKMLHDNFDDKLIESFDSSGKGKSVDPMSGEALQWEDETDPGRIAETREWEADINRRRPEDDPISLQPVRLNGGAGPDASVHRGGKEAASGNHGAAEVGQGAMVEVGRGAMGAGVSGKGKGSAAAFIRAFEKLFNKRVIFVRASKPWHNGLVSGDRANTILVNADTSAPVQTVLGHEFGHQIKMQNPGLWGEMRDLIDRVAPISPEYRQKKLGEKYKPDKIIDEWVSDVIGQHFDDKNFWEKLRYVSEKRGMGERFRDFAGSILSWLDSLFERFRKGLDLGAEAAARRAAEEIRNKIASVLVRYVEDMPAGGYSERAGASNTSASTGEAEPMAREKEIVPGGVRVGKTTFYASERPNVEGYHRIRLEGLSRDYYLVAYYEPASGFFEDLLFTITTFDGRISGTANRNEDGTERISIYEGEKLWRPYYEGKITDAAKRVHSRTLGITPEHFAQARKMLLLHDSKAARAEKARQLMDEARRPATATARLVEIFDDPALNETQRSEALNHVMSRADAPERVLVAYHNDNNFRGYHDSIDDIMRVIRRPDVSVATKRLYLEDLHEQAVEYLEGEKAKVSNSDVDDGREILQAIQAAYGKQDLSDGELKLFSGVADKISTRINKFQAVRFDEALRAEFSWADFNHKDIDEAPMALRFGMLQITDIEDIARDYIDESKISETRSNDDYALFEDGSLYIYSAGEVWSDFSDYVDASEQYMSDEEREFFGLDKREDEDAGRDEGDASVADYELDSGFVPPVAAAWLRLAKSDPAIFRYGKTESEDAHEIARAVSTEASPVRAEVAGERVVFHTRVGSLAISHAGSRRPFIQAISAGSRGRREGGGSQLYMAALDWIHNNGKRVRDDPAGITPINMTRRTSNFISSALRWGTTRHLMPHSAQGVAWSGSAGSRIDALLESELAHVEQHGGLEEGWRYDVGRNVFVDGVGVEITLERWRDMVAGMRPASSGIGEATMKRALMTKAFSEGDAKPGASGPGPVLYSTGSETVSDATPAAESGASGMRPNPIAKWLRDKLRAERDELAGTSFGSWFKKKFIDDKDAIRQMEHAADGIMDAVKRLAVMTRFNPDAALLVEGIEDAAEALRDFVYEYRGGMSPGMRDELEKMLERFDALAAGIRDNASRIEATAARREEAAAEYTAAVMAVDLELLDAQMDLEQAEAGLARPMDADEYAEAGERAAEAKKRVAATEALGRELRDAWGALKNANSALSDARADAKQSAKVEQYEEAARLAASRMTAVMNKVAVEQMERAERDVARAQSAFDAAQKTLSEVSAAETEARKAQAAAQRDLSGASAAETEAREAQAAAQRELEAAQRALEDARKMKQAAQKTVSFAEALLEARKLVSEMSALVPKPAVSTVTTPGLEDITARLRNSVDGVVIAMIENGMVDFNGRTVGGALKEAVAGLDDAGVVNLDRYLLAKRALAVWNDTKQPGRNPGIPKAEAEKTVAELESDDFIRRAKLVYAWMQGLRNYAAQASTAMALGRDKMEAADPGFYVPLWREGNGPDGYDDVLAPDGGPTDRFGKPLTGDEAVRTLWRPLDAIMKEAEIIVRRAHDRHLWETARAMALSNPLLSDFIREVDESEVLEAAGVLDEAREELDAAHQVELDAAKAAADAGEAVRQADEAAATAREHEARADKTAQLGGGVLAKYEKEKAQAQKGVQLAGDTLAKNEEKRAQADQTVQRAGDALAKYKEKRARTKGRVDSALFEDLVVDENYVYARDGGKWWAICKELFDSLNSLEVKAGKFGTTMLAKAIRETAGVKEGEASLTNKAIRTVEIIDWMLKLSAKSFRAGATGLRASFGLGTNIVRDFMTMQYNTRVQYDPLLVTKNWFKSMAVLGASALRGRAVLDETQTARYHELSRNLGMHFSNSLTFDSERLGIVMAKITHDKDGKINWKGEAAVKIDTVWQYFVNVMQFPEMAARIAEMRSLAEKNRWDITQGLNAVQIAELARAGKEVTVDFTRAGEWARIWNRYVPFINSSIQGKKSSYDAMKRNPVGWVFSRGLVASVAAAANWLRNKDDEWWKELTAGERFAYDFVKVGGEVLRIPRSFEVDAVFKGLVVEMLDAAYNEQPDRVMDWFKGFVEEMTVAGSLDTGINMDALPPALREGISQIANHDFYWKSPIVSRTQQELEWRDQFGPYTSHVAVRIGDIFHIPPRRIDHFVGGLFAGVGGDLMALFGRGPEWDAADVPFIGAAFKDSDWEPYDMPIAGRAFFRRGGEEIGGNRTVDRLYETYGRMREESRRIEGAGGRLDGGHRELIRAMSDAIRAVQVVGEARLVATTREQRQELSALRFETASMALQTLGDGTIGRHAGEFRRLQRVYKPARFEYAGGGTAAGLKSGGAD
jgi:hypothetical protein